MLLRTSALAAANRTGAHEIATAEEKITDAVERLGTIDDIKKTAGLIEKNAQKIEKSCSTIYSTIDRLLGSGRRRRRGRGRTRGSLVADAPAHLPIEMALPEVDCTVYSGWYPLLTRLHRQLTSVTSDFAYVQIKEKYGTLRCHVDYGESVDEFTRGVCEVLIGASTDESSTVCEFCGKHGSTRNDLPHIKTMCATCDRSRVPEDPVE